MDANPLQIVKPIAELALRTSFFTTVAAVVVAAREDQTPDMDVMGDVREGQKVDGTQQQARMTDRWSLQRPKNTKDTGKIVAKEYPSKDSDIHYGVMQRQRPEKQFTPEPEQHFE
ncbi:hypothetical protein DFH07DRAFT_777418 [Mycena maculata]|uniref:Uncharacterized protein n=1 Tax=Mycena maculata TaxID=230809 RepID=A0AAD7N351_9AGAR|nr:hypothetical protein DFH07DRAFT_777418 [Mycena maculata]